MHFFEKQRVGLIGQTSVSLQKILIFFMICNLFTFFNGGFLQFFLCLIGFIGAYKKKTCLLSIYFWVNIAIILFGLVSVVLMLGSSAPADDQWASSSSWASSSASSSVHPVEAQRWDHHPLAATAHKFATWAADYSSSAESSTESEETYSSSASQSSTNSIDIEIDIAPASSNAAESSSSYNQPEVYYDGRSSVVPTIVIILTFVLVFIFAYLQAKALALAWRLRKLLLLPAIPILNEPTPVPATQTQAGEQVHYFPNQENNSCAEPEPEQIQQPVVAPQPYPYYPYPYPQPYGVPQGMMMVPHQPTYWGQPPMYYSYAAPQPQSNGEKQ